MKVSEMTKFGSASRQRGLTLIEILVSLSILAATTAGVTRLINQYTEDTKSSVTAQYMTTVGMMIYIRAGKIIRAFV